MSVSTDLLGNGGAGKTAGAERLRRWISAAAPYLTMLGFGWLTPIFRLATGEQPALQLREIWRQLGVPVLAVGLFLVAWANLAPTVKTSLGAIPGPVEVWHEAGSLYADHVASRKREAAFYQRQEARNAARLAKDPNAAVKWRQYTGKPTYLDQIVTSLETVVHGLPAGHDHRGAARHGLRPVLRGQRGAQSADPDLQAGLAARLAADRDDGGQRDLRVERSDVREVLPHLGDHRDALLAVADPDQHRASASPRSTRTCSMSAGCSSSAGRPRCSSSCCRPRCR